MRPPYWQSCATTIFFDASGEAPSALDEWGTSDYLGPMLRRIVTLLALLSGLTVFGTPAQAALTQVLGSHAEASQNCEQTRQDEAIAQAHRPLEHAAWQAPSGRVEAGLAEDVAIPTVRFGADRAIE